MALPGPVVATVAELLDTARAAHQRYRTLVPHRIRAAGDQVVVESGSPAEARAAIIQALQFRVQAQALDPTFSDPAWQEDRVLHFSQADLLAWYRQQLTRPVAI